MTLDELLDRIHTLVPIETWIYRDIFYVSYNFWEVSPSSSIMMVIL